MAPSFLQHLSVGHTDTVSPDRVYVGELARLTGFSLRQAVLLELLGAHPSSSRSHVWGLNYDRAEVGAYTKLLIEPGYREWLLSLISDLNVVPRAVDHVELA